MSPSNPNLPHDSRESAKNGSPTKRSLSGDISLAAAQATGGAANASGANSTAPFPFNSSPQNVSSPAGRSSNGSDSLSVASMRPRLSQRSTNDDIVGDPNAAGNQLQRAIGQIKIDMEHFTLVDGLDQNSISRICSTLCMMASTMTQHVDSDRHWQQMPAIIERLPFAKHPSLPTILESRQISPIVVETIFKNLELILNVVPSYVEACTNIEDIEELSELAKKVQGILSQTASRSATNSNVQENSPLLEQDMSPSSVSRPDETVHDQRHQREVPQQQRLLRLQKYCTALWSKLGDGRDSVFKTLNSIILVWEVVLLVAEKSFTSFYPLTFLWHTYWWIAIIAIDTVLLVDWLLIVCDPCQHKGRCWKEKLVRGVVSLAFVFPYDFVLYKTGIMSGQIKLPLLIVKVVFFPIFKICRFGRAYPVENITNRIFGLIWDLTSSGKVSYAAMRSVKILFIWIVYAHWAACVQLAIVDWNGYPEESWVVQAGLKDASPPLLYSQALLKTIHQTITLTTGFSLNSTCPSNSRYCHDEKWTETVFQVIGAGVACYLYANVCFLVGLFWVTKDSYISQVISLEDALKGYAGLDSKSREAEMKKFRKAFPTYKMFDLDMFAKLGSYKRCGLTLIENLDMFEGVDSAFLVSLSNRMEFMLVDDGTPLYEAGDEVDAIYFVHEGQVNVLGGTNTYTVEDGSFFGLVEMVSQLDDPVRYSGGRQYSVVSESCCTLFKIKARTFASIVNRCAEETFPQITTKMRDEAMKRLATLEGQESRIV